MISVKLGCMYPLLYNNIWRLSDCCGNQFKKGVMDMPQFTVNLVIHTANGELLLYKIEYRVNSIHGHGRVYYTYMYYVLASSLSSTVTLL